ncbi:MAG: NTP transferase domain-containing protein [Candidatus Marinimicrobia bacterium]|nr:NTP transferase domain-containing protein [Candidatus Neomarinimicrobiota bacterium]
MTNKLLILAGGKSSRMKNSAVAAGLTKKEIEAANQKTKGMIEVNNRPFMDYILYNAKNAGIQDVIILTGENSSDIRNFYGQKDRENHFNGMTISYAVQFIPDGREKPFGTADAVYQAMEQIRDLQNEPFLVCNCDNLYSENAFRDMVQLETPNGWVNYDRNGLEFPIEKIEAFAITHTDKNGYLIDIIEKPTPEDVARFMDEEGVVRVSMNIFKFDGKLFFQYVKECPVNPKRNEKELQTAILNMVHENPGSMRGIPRKEHVPDLTSKEDILKVTEYLQINKIELNW